MIALFSGRPHENSLLPEGRMSGPMPWVIAIMMFLTVLAAATGLSLTRAAGSIGSAVAGRVTVQVVDAVKADLKMPDLKVNYAPVTSSNRIPLLENGTIDSAIPIIALQWLAMNRERLRLEYGGEPVLPK